LSGLPLVVDGQNQRAIFDPEIPFDTEAFSTYLDQHPAWKAFRRGNAESCMKISDFLSRAKWERTDLYHHIFRPLGFHYQLGFADGELPQLGIGLNRSRRDVTEEERSILDLLQRHLTQAFGTSQLFPILQMPPMPPARVTWLQMVWEGFAFAH
jgi:hypothetical protein